MKIHFSDDDGGEYGTYDITLKNRKVKISNGDLIREIEHILTRYKDKNEEYNIDDFIRLLEGLGYKTKRFEIDGEIYF